VGGRQKRDEEGCMATRERKSHGDWGKGERECAYGKRWKGIKERQLSQSKELQSEWYNVEQSGRGSNATE
jgi:hypothetical protein